MNMTTVIIARASDGIRNLVRGRLADYEIDWVSFEDPYSAAAYMSRVTVGNGLVIGRACDLNTEDGQFLRLAMSRSWKCCCICDGPVDKFRLSAQQLDEEVIEVEQMDDLARGIEMALEQEEESMNESPKTKKAVIREDYLASEEELNALLGG